MASVKFVAVSRGLSGILDYVTNREKTTDALITGVNCVAQTALDEFEAVKKQFHKTDGRGYYHIVQSFSPDDPLDFKTAHEIGIKFAGYFQGYQCVVATHMNTNHIHNHIIMNSVNCETGRKFHQSAREMQQAKEFSNQLCLQYGLSITETKADPHKIPAWKKKLRNPAYYDSFSKRIKEALDQYKEKVISEAEYLAKMRTIMEDYHAGKSTVTYPESIKNNVHAQAFYGVLSAVFDEAQEAEVSPDLAAEIAEAITKIVATHSQVDWTNNKTIHDRISQDIDDLFYDYEKERGLKLSCLFPFYCSA